MLFHITKHRTYRHLCLYHLIFRHQTVISPPFVFITTTLLMAPFSLPHSHSPLHHSHLSLSPHRCLTVIDVSRSLLPYPRRHQFLLSLVKLSLSPLGDCHRQHLIVVVYIIIIVVVAVVVNELTQTQRPDCCCLFNEFVNLFHKNLRIG